MVTASEWKRAAIVRAFVQKGNGRPRNDESVKSLTLSDFAKLGIVGLSSRPTVQRYYDTWPDSLPDPEPGNLAGIPWK